MSSSLYCYPKVCGACVKFLGVPIRVAKTTKKFDLTTKNPMRQGRNRNSKYPAQRRQGRKGRRITVSNFSKIIHLSPPNLAYFAPWRESIPLFEYFSSTENLRRPRKFSRMVVRRPQWAEIFILLNFRTSCSSCLLRKYGRRRFRPVQAESPRLRHSSMECWNPG